MTESEFDARLKYYWSKVRQELKKGDIEAAAGWLGEARVKEGGKMAASLKYLAGRLSRGEIHR